VKYRLEWSSPKGKRARQHDTEPEFTAYTPSTGAKHNTTQHNLITSQQQHPHCLPLLCYPNPQTQTYRRPRSPNVTTTFYSKSFRAPNLPSTPLFHRLWASHPCFWLRSQSHSSCFLHPFLCLSRLSGTGPSAFRFPSCCPIPFPHCWQLHA